MLLKRDIEETIVNNYNPEWVIPWDANHAIQPVLDFFAVITYVTDYWAIPDEGIPNISRNLQQSLNLNQTSTTKDA